MVCWCLYWWLYWCNKDDGCIDGYVGDGDEDGGCVDDGYIGDNDCIGRVRGCTHGVCTVVRVKLPFISKKWYSLPVWVSLWFSLSFSLSFSLPFSINRNAFNRWQHCAVLTNHGLRCFFGDSRRLDINRTPDSLEDPLDTTWCAICPITRYTLYGTSLQHHYILYYDRSSWLLMWCSIDRCPSRIGKIRVVLYCTQSTHSVYI